MPQLQLIADLPGHSDPAWCISFNPTRPLIATCSTDKTVRLFSYVLPSTPGASSSALPAAGSAKPSVNLLTTIQTSHKRTVRWVSWAPSGRTLATGSFDSTVGVWEEVEGSDEDEDEGAEGVYRPKAAREDDGEEDDEMDGDGDAGPTAGKEWECVTTLEGHESECKNVAFSKDGALLASCSRDKSVWVWEVQPDADFECIAVMMDHSQDVKALAWHPVEEILASASYDATIHLMFDDPDGDWCIFQKLHPQLPPSPLVIPNPSPSLVAALSPDETERKAEVELKVPPLQEDETVWSLAWSPCGRYLASGGDIGGIRLWTRKGHNPDSRFEETLHTAAHSRSCFSLSWSPGGLSEDQGGLGLLASSGGDGKIIVWQVTGPPPVGDGDPEAAQQGLKMEPIAAVRDAHGVADVNCVAWCVREDGKGRGMLGSVGDDGTIKVWRMVA